MSLPDEVLTGEGADAEPDTQAEFDEIDEIISRAESFTDIPLDMEMPCPDGYDPAVWEKKPATQKRFYLWAMANTKRITGGQS